MSIKDFQEELQQLFQDKFKSETTVEWASQMHNNSYSPKLDVAVGPYSIQNGVNLMDEYDNLFDNNIITIGKMTELHLRNIDYLTNNANPDEINAKVGSKLNDLRYFNFNSRCFISVEIENEVSRKHLMGGAINASVLGRIAIVIGFTEEKHRAFKRLFKYFEFLQSVQKPTFRTENLLVISKEQILNVLKT